MTREEFDKIKNGELSFEQIESAPVDQEIAQTQPVDATVADKDISLTLDEDKKFSEPGVFSVGGRKFKITETKIRPGDISDIDKERILQELKSKGLLTNKELQFGNVGSDLVKKLSEEGEAAKAKGLPTFRDKFLVTRPGTPPPPRESTGVIDIREILPDGTEKEVDPKRDANELNFIFKSKGDAFPIGEFRKKIKSAAGVKNDSPTDIVIGNTVPEQSAEDINRSPNSALDDILNPPIREIDRSSLPPVDQVSEDAAKARVSSSSPTKTGSRSSAGGSLPSTFPQVQTFEDIQSQNLSSGNRISSGVEQLAQFQEKILKAQGGAEAAQAEQNIQSGQNRQQELDNEIEQQRALRDRLIQTKEDLAKNISEKIDPNRAFKDANIFTKLALVFGAALQGAAGSDAGLRAIDSIIERDIEAQKQDIQNGISKQGGLLDAISKSGVAIKDLSSVGVQISKQIADQFGKLLAAGVKIDTAKEAAISFATLKAAPILQKQVNDTQKTIQSGLELEQKARNDDINNELKRQAIQAENIKARTEKIKLTAKDSDNLEAFANMAQASAELEQLENRKGFNPTRFSFSLSQFASDKGIPGSLNKDESAYVAAFSRYLVFFKRTVTGAASSISETSKISSVIGLTSANQKDSIRDFQKRRRDIIGVTFATVNKPARDEFISSFPELKKFTRK